MQVTKDFLVNYGQFTFDKLPFGDVDAALLCQMFYMPVEKVAPIDFVGIKTFKQVAEELFSYNGNKHVAPGLVLTKKISKKMMMMSAVPRYADIKITGVQSVYRENPAVQYCSATMILPTGEIFVIFRGTDDSLIGWKEDVDIFTRRTIPSHKLAIDYLKAVEEHYPDGDIIIAGHSKGGNVALYGGIMSAKSIRDRIKALYNLDGPGFVDYSYFATEGYLDILPKYKHLVPKSSFVGMLLAHDNDYEVIDNRAILGPIQHDLENWAVDSSALARKKKLTPLGKFNDFFLGRLTANLNSTQIEALDRMFEAVVIKGTGQYGLADLPKHMPSAIKGAKKAWETIEADDKESFISCFEDTPKYVKDFGREVEDDAIEAIKDKLDEFSEKRKISRTDTVQA